MPDPFAFGHLSPLAEVAVQGVNPPEGFHRQEEDQLKMGNSTSERPALQGGDESFPRRHESSAPEYRSRHRYLII